ncbi:hypothetical protein D3C78_814770 [compost metagenome]
MNSRQLPAVLLAPGHQGHFTLQCDCVGNQPATGFEFGPAGIEHALAGDAAADENRIRPLQPGQCLRRAAANQLQAGNAEGIAVVFDQRLSARICLDGQCAATGVGAHPFDADRTAAGADIPQQFAGDRGQAREGDGAHIALGQLAVVPEGGVRQAGQSRQA